MRLSLARIMGPKRRCSCLNIKNVIWKLRGRKKNTKPGSDYKASVSSVTCVTDIQLFLEIWHVQDKQQGNTSSLSGSYKSLPSSHLKWHLHGMSSTLHLRQQEDDNALIFGRGWKVSRDAVKSGCLVSRGSLVFL